MKSVWVISLLIFSLAFGQSGKGKIAGVIKDGRTLQPLPGANVMVEGSDRGAATDSSGYFSIPQLEPGSYNLQVVFLGYIPVKKNNVVVNPGRTTVVEYELEESVIEGEAIEVQGSYFEKPREAVVSTRSMNFEEIRRSPGDVQDIQRAVQAFPAVVSGADQYNEIIIRGGIPGENLFIMDQIEIPNPNHFAVQGAGGGPINLLNSYMVRDLDFYAGAFSARYGDKASSVMEISLREGSRDRFRGDVNMGLAGFGGLIEGPIGDNASYMFSARKSYLELIIESTGLTAVPQYYNLQSKIAWDINPSNKLLFNAVYGNDAINIEEGDEGGYGRGAENVDSENDQTIAGLTLRTFWNKQLYSYTTLSAVHNNFFADVYEIDENDREDTFFVNESAETELHFKSDFFWQLSKNTSLNFGGGVKQVRLDYAVTGDPDTLFLYEPQSSRPDSAVGIFQINPPTDINENIVSYKSAAFVQLSQDFLRRMRFTAGLRYDYFDYTGYTSWSPRLGLSWYATPKLTLNAAYGLHYQTPSYIELVSNPLNRDLDSKFTRQYVLGLDYLFRDDMKLTVEGYYKSYHDVPLEQSLTTPEPLDDDNGRLLTAGEGEAYGIEFFFQKKLLRQFSTIISYAASKSTAVDPRTGETYDWDYDYRHVFTAIAGYKFLWREKSWFRDIKGTWWYQSFSWLPFFPADEDEISFKWRYLGGRPYTPPVYDPLLREWLVQETDDLNPTRFPAYHRLDLRIDKRYLFENFNLVVFYDLINLYNRDNIWNYNYNDDGTRDKILQYKTLPVVGISLEF